MQDKNTLINSMNNLIKYAFTYLVISQSVAKIKNKCLPVCHGRISIRLSPTWRTPCRVILLSCRASYYDSKATHRTAVQ